MKFIVFSLVCFAVVLASAEAVGLDTHNYYDRAIGAYIWATLLRTPIDNIREVIGL